MLGEFTVRRKLDQWSYEQLKSDPSTYVDNCEKRKDDSIRLRQMDGAVGTGPEEHLMRDFERMKISLLFLDGMVLRNTGDTAIFLGLEITETSRGFEVRNSHEVVDPLLSLYAGCKMRNQLQLRDDEPQ